MSCRTYFWFDFSRFGKGEENHGSGKERHGLPGCDTSHRPRRAHRADSGVQTPGSGVSPAWFVGTTKNPTYHRLGDHTETIQIDYDPTQVSYQELLDIFWDSHNPTRPAWSRQYASIIFFHNDEQKRLAIETRDREAARLNGQIYTEIVPATEFYLAEAYHQKHQLRQMPDLMREFEAMYPATDDFINSTVAARVNGYLGGYGTFADLQVEVSDLGLIPAESEKLLNIVYTLRD